jgi:hypothetical protein
MKAFAYHPRTGAYLGEVECQPNPRELGEFLVPGNATMTPPPKPSKGKHPFWDRAKWVLKKA